jgi:hypothetical protein
MHLYVMVTTYCTDTYLEEQNARWSLQYMAFVDMFSSMKWDDKAMRTSLRRHFIHMLEGESDQHAKMLELQRRALENIDSMIRLDETCSWFESMRSRSERGIYQFLRAKQANMDGFYMWLYSQKRAFDMKFTIMLTADDMRRVLSHEPPAESKHTTSATYIRKKERPTTQDYFMVERFVMEFRQTYTRSRLVKSGNITTLSCKKLFEDALLETDTIIGKLWEKLQRADETPQMVKEEITEFLNNERTRRHTYQSDEKEQRKLILERHKRFISQFWVKQLCLKEELAKAEQRRIAQIRLAEQRRIEEEHKAEQRRLAQERTRAIQERRRAEEAQVEERRRAERVRQAQRRMEIIRAEREGRTRGQDLGLRDTHQPIMDLHSPGAPAPPRPSSMSVQPTVSPLQVQYPETAATSETTQPRSVEKSEKHAHDNGCIWIFFDGGVEGVFPKADFDKFKATFEIPRFGLDLYRYLTLPKDESSTECNICLDASGLLTCGRNSGGKNCEGSLCWECFHSCFVEDKKCPLCRMDYIPLAERSPTQPVRIPAGKTGPQST